MNQEPLTLYKLIVLYLLNKVSFPLTMAQVSDLILEKEYTSYLTLQQVINELAQAGLITAKTLVNRTHLQITEEGRNTLSYFENRISDAIKTDIGEYLKKNELEMRNESSIQSNYYKAVNGEFETELTAVDKDVNLVTIRLTVAFTEELAISICENWQKNNREIYQYLTTALFLKYVIAASPGSHCHLFFRGLSPKVLPMSRPHPRARYFFFTLRHQLLHCIPTLQKGLIVCLTRQIPVVPFMPCAQSFSAAVSCSHSSRKNHPSFASSIRKQFSSAPMFAASSRVRILSIPKSSRLFSVSSTFLVRFCTSALFSTDGCR